jgi:hypothetical protein
MILRDGPLARQGRCHRAGKKLGKPHDLGRRIPLPGAPTYEHPRLLRGKEELSSATKVVIEGPHGERRPVSVGTDDVVFRLAPLGVGREIQVDRSRAATGGDAQGAAKGFRKLVCVSDHRRVFGDCGKEPGLRERAAFTGGFLERSFADGGGADLSGKNEHRQGAHIGRSDP